MMPQSSPPATAISPPIASVGCQWIVDANGCDGDLLTSIDVITSLCEDIIDSLQLHVLGDPAIHRFAHPHGITALYLLSESHLAIHTYPEHGLLTLNLVCCREDVSWPWQAQLRQRLRAGQVQQRLLRRGHWSEVSGK